MYDNFLFPYPCMPSCLKTLIVLGFRVQHEWDVFLFPNRNIYSFIMRHGFLEETLLCIKKNCWFHAVIVLDIMNQWVLLSKMYSLRFSLQGILEFEKVKNLHTLQFFKLYACLGYRSCNHISRIFEYDIALLVIDIHLKINYSFCTRKNAIMGLDRVKIS